MGTLPENGVIPKDWDQDVEKELIPEEKRFTLEEIREIARIMEIRRKKALAWRNLNTENNLKYLKQYLNELNQSLKNLPHLIRQKKYKSELNSQKMITYSCNEKRS